MEPTPRCCLPNCGRDADWLILDPRDKFPDQPSLTHACTAHVGELLGDSEHLPPRPKGEAQWFQVHSLQCAQLVPQS